MTALVVASRASMAASTSGRMGGDPRSHGRIDGWANRRKSHDRHPVRTWAGPRRSKRGPSDSYSETWDGEKYDMTTMGMWDVPSIEGPSCIRLPPIEAATVSELEALYAQAKNTYFSGQPVVDDAMFDNIERRLRYLGSDAAVKYPRCSRQDMRVYSDASCDVEQMDALAGTWLFFAALGVGMVAVDFGEAIREGIGAVAGGGVAHGAAAAAHGSFRPPVIGLLGIFLANGGLERFGRLRAGQTVAMKGDCPSCGEEVYAFMPGNAPTARVECECHVCERGERQVAEGGDRADLPRGQRGWWRRGVQGRRGRFPAVAAGTEGKGGRRTAPRAMSSRLFFSIFLKRERLVRCYNRLTYIQVTYIQVTYYIVTRYRRHCPPLSSSDDLNSLK